MSDRRSGGAGGHGAWTGGPTAGRLLAVWVLLAATGPARAEPVPAGDPPRAEHVSAGDPSAGRQEQSDQEATAGGSGDEPATDAATAGPAGEDEAGGQDEAARESEAAGNEAGTEAGTPDGVQDAPVLLQPPPAWPREAPPLERVLWAGSWSVDDPHGFLHPWIDETGLRETFTLRPAGRRRWTGMFSDEPLLPLDRLIRDRTGPAAAYTYVLVQREGEGPDRLAPGAYRDQEAILHVRHRGRLRAWLDGRLVLDIPPPAGGGTGHAAVPVTLTDAFDVLLVKVGRGSDELGPSFAFTCRLTAPDGSILPGTRWNTMRPPGYPREIP